MKIVLSKYFVNIFFCFFLFYGTTLTCISQTDSEILQNAVLVYKKVLPSFEKNTFKVYRSLLKKENKPSIKDFKNYQFLFIPTYHLDNRYFQQDNETSIIKYIDFNKICYDYDAFIFRDSLYKGLMNLSNFQKPFLIPVEQLIFRENIVAYQISIFNPDIVFYPESGSFLFFIKDLHLFAARVIKMDQVIEDVKPIEEYYKDFLSFKEELYRSKWPELKRYKILK